MTKEDASHESSRRWRKAYMAETILLLLLAATAFGGRLRLVHIEYIGGLNNSFGDEIWAAFSFYGVLAIISVILVICAVIQLFLSPRTYGHVLLRFGFLVIIPVILVGSILVPPPRKSNAFERGYEQWILKEVDIDAIQQWLAAEGHKYKGHNSIDRENDTRGDFPEELPGFFTEFKPKYTLFYDSTSQGGPCVEFEWGGPLAHWGFIIGLPAMPMPEKGFINLTPTLFEYRHPIKPGVYIFERG